MQYGCAMLSSVVYPAPMYFSTYLINGTIFGNKVLNIKHMSLFSLHLLLETFLIPRRIVRDGEML
jgi:hypothetical protein